MGERVERLHATIRRAKAELTGVENGTLLFLEERGHGTPREVAEALDLSLPAANNRLMALAREGVILRKLEKLPGGGRQFRYYVPPKVEGPWTDHVSTAGLVGTGWIP